MHYNLLKFRTIHIKTIRSSSAGFEQGDRVLTNANVSQVVLCFSPVGSALRVRARKFPSIINCTAINWFHEWPQEALMSVSKRFLQELQPLPVGGRVLPRCGSSPSAPSV